MSGLVRDPGRDREHRQVIQPQLPLSTKDGWKQDKSECVCVCLYVKRVFAYSVNCLFADYMTESISSRQVIGMEGAEFVKQTTRTGDKVESQSSKHEPWRENTLMRFPEIKLTNVGVHWSC